MAGRKSIPSILKLLRGNPGKRPVNKQEPSPQAGVPDCPSWLTQKAKETWKQIAPILDGMRVLTKADRQALELLCDAYAEYRKARETILKRGLTYTSKTSEGKIIRPLPEVSIAADASRRLRAMLLEFGLTPSSRSRIQVGSVYHEDSLDKFLKRAKDRRRFFGD